MDKIKIAQEFLKTLEDSKETMNIMTERVDLQILYVIHEYAELIANVKNKTNISEKDILSCAVIIGYLLKGHMDRYELEQIMESSEDK